MNASCIIPAFNEEKSVAKVVLAAKKCGFVGEVIVVDDGSSDRTASVAEKAGAIVLRKKRNGGKGAAIKLGVENSAGKILVFLDADLENISAKKIEKMLKPIRSGKTDFVKTSFDRAKGRVTNFVAKPLLKITFPWVEFKQPLSGQVAIKKSVFSRLEIDDSWGIEVQMLIQAIRLGFRVKEVNIGRLVHKHRPDAELAQMSEHIIESMLSEIGLIRKRHKAIFFDLDKTLIKDSSIEVFAREWGFESELNALRKRFAVGKISDGKITVALAGRFRGKSVQDVERVCRKIRARKNAAKVISHLRRMRYRVRIVSSAFSPVAGFFAKKFGVYDYFAPKLVIDKNGKFTGKLAMTKLGGCKKCTSYVCKDKALRGFQKKNRIPKSGCVAVGDGKNDRCMFDAAGLSLTLNPKNVRGNAEIRALSEVLLFVE